MYRHRVHKHTAQDKEGDENIGQRDEAEPGSRYNVNYSGGEPGQSYGTMKVLSGSIPMDSGRIFIRGEEIHHLTPERAQELGIGMVYQELSLVPTLTVAENIFLGQWPKTRLGIVDWPEINKQAELSLARLGVSIDPRLEVRQLDVAEQQLTEIARVLTRQPEILLLDEPTSALSDTERERMIEIIGRLRGRGRQPEDHQLGG